MEYRQAALSRTEVKRLPMESLEEEAFFADKVYDTDALLDMLEEIDISAVIPPVKSRKEQ